MIANHSRLNRVRLSLKSVGLQRHIQLSDVIPVDTNHTQTEWSKHIKAKREIFTQKAVYCNFITLVVFIVTVRGGAEICNHMSFPVALIQGQAKFQSPKNMLLFRQPHHFQLTGSFILNATSCHLLWKSGGEQLRAAPPQTRKTFHAPSAIWIRTLVCPHAKRAGGRWSRRWRRREKNDAKPEHSAGRTRRADGSQLTRSVIVTPDSLQFVLHWSDVSRFFVNNTGKLKFMVVHEKI